MPWVHQPAYINIPKNHSPEISKAKSALGKQAHALWNKYQQKYGSPIQIKTRMGGSFCTLANPDNAWEGGAHFVHWESGQGWGVVLYISKSRQWGRGGGTLSVLKEIWTGRGVFLYLGKSGQGDGGLGERFLSSGQLGQRGGRWAGGGSLAK